MLLLEGFQAGLSWAIVLRKREAFRAALDGFDPAKVAAYGEAEIQRLLANPAIIRSERKLRAAADKAESLTGSKAWRFPTYGDLLFSV